LKDYKPQYSALLEKAAQDTKEILKLKEELKKSVPVRYVEDLIRSRIKTEEELASYKSIGKLSRIKHRVRANALSEMLGQIRATFGG
jgi:hypothetical protein